MLSNLRISPDVAKAALILSREHVMDEGAARDAISRLETGDDLLSLSFQMLSLPMVAKHLSVLKPDWYEAEKTKTLALQFALSQLLLRGEQQAFTETCLEPAGQIYAFFKGFALADQFYRHPGMRFARDIDVLVRRHAVVGVIERALAQGYKLVDPSDQDSTLSDRHDIRAALRYLNVFCLLTPKGNRIEVHREVDKDQGIFDERQLLFRGCEVEQNNGRVHTLEPADHFIYVAYHCARHNWSKLHWLADLAAMAQSPLIDHEHLMERADELGLRGLIEETLGYVRLSADPHNIPSNAPGSRILYRVLDIAEQGEQRARDLANTQTSTALPFPDMLSPWLRKKVRARRLWARLKPHISDYQTMPLPDRWQWIYWLTGPPRRILRKVLS